MIFTDDAGHEYCFPQKGLNIWQSSFDAVLSDMGAELRDETVALSCVTRNSTISAQISPTMRTESERKFSPQWKIGNAFFRDSGLSVIF